MSQPIHRLWSAIRRTMKDDTTGALVALGIMLFAVYASTFIFLLPHFNAWADRVEHSFEQSTPKPELQNPGPKMDAPAATTGDAPLKVSSKTFEISIADGYVVPADNSQYCVPFEIVPLIEPMPAISFRAITIHEPDSRVITFTDFENRPNCVIVYAISDAQTGERIVRLEGIADNGYVGTHDFTVEIVD